VKGGHDYRVLSGGWLTMNDFPPLGVVSFAFGAILLLISLLGGGFEVKEIRFSHFGRSSRISLGVFGGFFIVLGFWVTTMTGQSTLDVVDHGTSQVAPSPGSGVTEPVSDVSSAPTEAVSSSPDISQEAYPNEKERSLLSRLPAELRDNCERGSWGHEGEAPVAVLHCFPVEGADVAWYAVFVSKAAADALYDDQLLQAGLSREAGPCGERSPTGENATRMEDGSFTGRHMCFVRDGVAWMHWVRYERYFSSARRYDGDRQKLFEWWKSAGPRDD
jgi:hypothetical protein